MKFRLQGDPSEGFMGPDEDTVHGVMLYRDRFVEVTDPEKIRRLKTHMQVEDGLEMVVVHEEAIMPPPKRRGRPPKPKPTGIEARH